MTAVALAPASRPLAKARRVVVALMLWVPGAERPGVLAYLVAVIRATVLGYLVALPVAFLDGGDIAKPSLARLLTTLGFVFFEELARFAHSHRATNKLKALLVFFACTTVVETVGYLDSAHGAPPLGLYLLTRTPAILVHVAATAAFAFAYARPRALLATFVAVTLAHTAFDFLAPTVAAHLAATHHVGAVLQPRV